MAASDAHMTGKSRGQRVGTILTTLASLLFHAGLALVLWLGWLPAAPTAVEPPAFEVALVPAPRHDPAPELPPRPAAAAAAKPQPAKALPARRLARTVVAHPHPAPLPVATTPARGFGPGLSEQEIAGATSAESGAGGGGDCNMAHMVQAALRKDPVVQSALRDLGNRAVLVWNGSWMQARGEDGNGLAAVREAIMWEVAFAPEACRRQTVRGLVLLSISNGGARLGLGPGPGQGEWHWSDVVTRPQAR